MVFRFWATFDTGTVSRWICHLYHPKNEINGNRKEFIRAGSCRRDSLLIFAYSPQRWASCLIKNQPVYMLMHKVLIRTICRLSCANLGPELCIANLWILHVLAHTILDVVMRMLIERWPWWSPWCWMKNLSSIRKVGNNVLRRSQTKKWTSFALSHSNDGCALYLYDY